MSTSSNILTLEENWKKYRNKKIIKKIVYFTFFIIFFIAILSLYYFLTLKNHIKINFEKLDKNYYLDKNKSILLDNSISILSLSNIKIKPKIRRPILEIKQNDLHYFQISIEKMNKENFIKNIKNNLLTDKKNLFDNQIQFLIDKFHESKDINYSLLLSEEFYSNNDFENSLKWALISNEIDPSNETSWILFAKSKIKLNLKKEAILALETYLSRYNSTSAKLLLNSIK